MIPSEHFPCAAGCSAAVSPESTDSSGSAVLGAEGAHAARAKARVRAAAKVVPRVMLRKMTSRRIGWQWRFSLDPPVNVAVERVVTDECPLDLGRWGFLRTPTHQAKGHPVDAILPQPLRGFR